ncbi:MAG: hypothetical protein WC323_00395 [Patescibacteria group bacterium]|jgi:vacuolar-type H+-ATPase subunit I/STV1
MNNQEPTNKDILKAVSGLVSKVDKIEKSNSSLVSKVSEIEKSNNELMEVINTFAANTENRFQGMEKEIIAIKATMVTKDYLDDKLSDLKGDLVVLMRKEDAKLCGLVDLLKNKKVISEEEAKNILAMQPFPQLV